VANGHLRDSVNIGDSTIFNWDISYPINNYDVSIYVGKFRLLHDTYTSKVTGKDIQFNHYVLGYNYEKAKEHLKQAKDIIAFYEKTYGPYPWYRDGYKLVESPYEGMEHQTAIAYGNGYKNSYGQPFDYIILHETAHEWWGNSITAADLADVWIQEGMATYAEALYVEATQGKEAYLNYLNFYRITIINRRPVVGPTGRRWFWYKDGDVYVKGAWMIHTLRTVINDDPVFFDILKSFREEYNCKTVTSQDFISWVNKKTHEDYTWFFKQYLNNRFTPILEYYAIDNRLYYRWTKVNDDFDMNISMQMNGDNEALTLSPTKEVMELQGPDIFRTILFSDDKQLFGTRENKHLQKMFRKMHPGKGSEKDLPK
jgi:aminopeptidase N